MTFALLWDSGLGFRKPFVVHRIQRMRGWRLQNQSSGRSVVAVLDGTMLLPLCVTAGCYGHRKGGKSNVSNAARGQQGTSFVWPFSLLRRQVCMAHSDLRNGHDSFLGP